MYGVTKRTKNIRAKAIRSRISIDSSFLPCGLVGLVGKSAMLGSSLNERDRTRPHEKDGSAAAASRPFPSRAARRIDRPLPACIPNRWDKNGRQMAAKAK